LNCILSGSDDTCVNLSIETTFSQCDDVCKDAGSTNAQIGPCVDAVDCFNNGGQFDAATGHCTIGPDNCELRDLPLATLGLTACHDKSGNLVQGSSGSSGECNAARGNQITIFP
jgi:nitrite reductase/ring-hydroxylating ferredoxin subunit